jgi:hypothetical protein
MGVGAGIMVVVVGLQGDQVQLAEPHAALGLEPVGECQHGGDWTLEQHRLETVFVIEPLLGRGGDQVW